MPRLKYEPLPTEGGYIRLVTLPPGEKQGHVNCSISHHRLSEAPKYEAVSYCWGHPNDKTTVTCEGQDIEIPTTLNDFLLRTRAKGTERIIWADSICVNQADDIEKASQVRQMRDIYRNAFRTLIWLGKESDHSTLGLDFAIKLSDALMVPAEQKNTFRHKLLVYREFSTVFSQKWKAFFEIFERPWFSRAWIVQEAVVSPNSQFVCGDNSLPWTYLIRALFYISTDQMWISEFYGTAETNVAMSLWMSQLEITQDTKTSHFEILMRYRQSIASDPRDKVFSFFGLSCLDSFNEHGIVPNYKDEAEEVYTELAMSTLRRASNLDFLSVPRLRIDGELDIPSWVPDWSCHAPLCATLLRLELGPNRLGLVVPYKATGESTYTPAIDRTTKRLELSGYVIDKILSVGKPWVVQETRGYQSIRKQALVLKQNQGFIHDWWGVARSSPGAYPTGEDVEEIIWQLCVAGFFIHGKEKTAEIYKKFDKRQRYLRIIRRLGLQDYIWAWILVVIIGHILRLIGIPNPQMAFRTLTSCMISRKIFRTDKGYLGLGPRIAEEGDYVALFKGGKLPFVIRSKGSEWEFIGDAYVHGMTDGQFWKEEKCGSMWLS